MQYPSGAASLFSSLARQQAPKKCEWCGENGGEGGRYIGGFYIPNGHHACGQNAKLESAKCCCYEFAGDNPNCTLHGGRK